MIDFHNKLGTKITQVVEFGKNDSKLLQEAKVVISELLRHLPAVNPSGREARRNAKDLLNKIR